MNAVERLREYTLIEQEHSLTPSDAEELQHWPSKGEIQLKSVSYRHRDGLPLVLKQIDLTIEGGQRIGIVGRTGSGKSSLLAAIFRLNDVAEGKVVIDGIDTQTLGVRQLREKLSIIPQEPQLFIGTVRYNIDPFNQYTDEQLWNALEVAGLTDKVSALEVRSLLFHFF